MSLRQQQHTIIITSPDADITKSADQFPCLCQWISTSTVLATILSLIFLRQILLNIPRWIQIYIKVKWKLFVAKIFHHDKSSSEEEDIFSRDLLQWNSSTSTEQLLGPLGIAQQMSDMMKLANEQMEQAKGTTSLSLDSIQMKMAAITLLISIHKIRSGEKEDHDNLLDEIYLNSGIPYIPNQFEKDYYYTMLQLSMWAYINNTDDIRSKLLSSITTNKYYLLRHVTMDTPGRVSHYIAMDIIKRIVYFAIRGTDSISDAITDLCGVPTKYQLPGQFYQHQEEDEEGKSSQTTTTATTDYYMTCHTGILDASIHFVDEVQPIIESLFIPSGFKIVFVGHSLGAGVASVASVILRSRIIHLQEQDNLVVIGFAPPPVMDYKTAIHTKSFITSIVNNFDIIPRSSMWTVIALISTLEQINHILEIKGLSPNGTKEAFHLMRKLSNGDTDVILTSEEVYDCFIEKENRHEMLTDKNFVFVPGKVIVMYQKNKISTSSSNEKNKYNKISENDSNYNTMIDDINNTPPSSSVIVNAIITDCGSTILGNIFPGIQMFTDHFTAAYETTLALWE